jgi:hypothetical protein
MAQHVAAPGEDVCPLGQGMHTLLLLARRVLEFVPAAHGVQISDPDLSA